MNWSIEELIPHRGRMKLIEEVLFVDKDKAITSATVNEKWPLFKEGSISPIILIEIIAQTAGITIGNERRKEVNKGAQGWLVGIKNASISLNKIPLGTKLTNSASRKYDRGNYAVFEGNVKIEEEIIFQIELQLFNPEKES